MFQNPVCAHITTIRNLKQNTIKYVIICISRPAKPTDANKVIIRNDPNHILYHEGECWSSAGNCKGVQYIQLSDRCFSERTISHELMHSIGFLHEHQRPDRDLYVYINESCITKGYEEEFKIHKNLLTFGLRYRAKSIMHYSSNAFSVGNCPTIISKVSIYNYLSNFFCQLLLTHVPIQFLYRFQKYQTMNWEHLMSLLKKMLN